VTGRGLRRRLAVLAGWEATLATPSLDFGEWAESTPDASGVIHMPWYQYSDVADRFVRAVNGAGWVHAFDWMAWAASPAGQELLQEPSHIATADEDDLSRLLTTIFRSDRFNEGAIASAFDRGLLLAIARRAKALLESQGEGR
jgi:hypothetical protein